MKKALSLILVCLMAALALGACGEKEKTESDAPKKETVSGLEIKAPKAISLDSLKNMGQLEEMDEDNSQWGITNGVMVYAFKLNDSYYRAITRLTEEQDKAINDIDYGDEDYEEKRKEIFSAIEIEKIEDLTDQILSREKLDEFVGKTGKDLLDNGWNVGGQYNLETLKFYMDYGPFAYSVVFEGEIPEEKWENFDDTEDIRDLKIKSVEFATFGDATNIETEEE